MNLHDLAELVSTEPTLAAAISDRAEGLREIALRAPESLRPFLTQAMAVAGPEASVVLAITATAREAEDLEAQVGELIGAENVAHYPAWETLPHERLSPRSDTVGRRLAVLRRLVHPGTTAGTGPLRVVTAPVRSLLQPQVQGLADLKPVELRLGAEVALETVIADLAAAAYARVDLVERRGEFAVRGGIVDVFPPTEEHPLRIEFWGDTVEGIRRFAVADQRTLEPVDHVWAPPCRELLLTDQVRARARALAAGHPGLRELLEKLAEGHVVEGMESLSPVLVTDSDGSGMELLVDLLPAGSSVLLCDPERVRARAADLVATSAEFLEASWASTAGSVGGQAPIDLGSASFRTLEEVRDEVSALDLGWLSISPFGLDDQDRAVDMEAAPTYRGDTAAALADIKGWVGQGRRTLVVVPGHGQAQRTTEWLAEHDVAATAVPSDGGGQPSAGVVEVVLGEMDHGFVSDPLGLVVITYNDLVGQRPAERGERKMPARRRKQIDPLELASGDFIVHEQH